MTGLAINSYAGHAALSDGPNLLNLAWTSDERGQLSVDLAAVLSAQLACEIDEGLPYLSSYPVQDPYGQGLLGPSVARFFGLEASSIIVVAGAGVGSLVAALSSLSATRTVHVSGTVYPDFPAWVERLGRTPRFAQGLEETLDRAQSESSPLIFLERPQLLAGDEHSAADIAELCRRIPQAIVIVDESNANYCPPGDSLVNQVGALGNLVVLRGYSKGYQMGGLRLGLCIASAGLSRVLHSAVPPLLASPLSVRLGSAILELGDICARLRDAIAVARLKAEGLLSAAGLAPTLTPNRALPYLLFEPGDPRLASFAELKIQGKQHVIRRAGSGCGWLYRLSVPLDDARMTRLERMIGGSSGQRSKA